MEYYTAKRISLNIEAIKATTIDFKGGNTIMPAEISSLLIALAVALLSYVISYINNKKLKDKVRTIEEALQSDENEYYIECPNCKTKICLSKVKIIAERKIRGEK